jgi:small subunit ribosomal protein S2
MLLTAQSHLGHATSLWNPRNSAYIFGIRDGIHIISLDATFSYLRRAAKVVTEIARRGGLILFVGTRDGHEDIVVNAARRAGGYHVFDRWTPGSLTNGQQILGRCAVKVVDVLDRELPQYSARMAESAAAGAHPVLKPDLVICLNPLENEVCLHECGLHNVPTIGIIDTDADPSWVTYPIPANDDSLRCVMLVAGVLGRAGEEGQRMRLEEAQKGRPTYNTKAAEVFLKGLEELKGLAGDVQDNSGPTN